MDDMISRQAAIDELSQRYIIMDNPHYIGYNAGLDEAQKVIKALTPVQQEDGWLEKNKDRILQAGLEGREVEFRIGGRLFAIREKAQ